MTRRVLHLSDLHFGRDRPELLRPLIEAVNRLAPDLVAVSGDFTQRARLGQFRAAHAFLARLEPPWIAVPGNHDTPLDNLAVRVFTPWHRYRRYIAADLEPVWSDDAMVVAGVNTVNPWSWQRGRVGRRTVSRVCDVFGGRREARMRIVVLHHPLEHGPEVDKRLMRGAADALRALGTCGADIVLSGHLHAWHARPFAGQGGVLFVQAGTGLSTRVRGEPNDFNLLTIDGTRLAVDRWAAGDGSARFERLQGTAFEKRGAGWVSVDG